jgi:CRP-like cAMP-binding protein
MDTRILQRGESAYATGKKGPAWLVERGSLEVEDNEGHIALLDEGSIAGAAGLVGKPYLSTATASVDNTVLVRLDAEGLVRRAAENPHETEQTIKKLLSLVWHYLDNKAL